MANSYSLDNAQPGLIVLFGSGETSPSGRKVFNWVFQQLGTPLKVSVLETPAGFELNSPRVAGRVADFITRRLQNYNPEVAVIPARKRGTEFSPDDKEILTPMLDSHAIFLGPGSPTYTVRQLYESVAWDTLVARHRLGAAIVLASAASIAASRHVLPVYEIYKAGDEPHWRRGLNFFGPFGLELVLIPHWNNAEGGAELDTSRCFMGQPRFEILKTMLPESAAIVGIDEHTALAFDFAAQQCHVLGNGQVTILRGSKIETFKTGASFPFNILGNYVEPVPSHELPETIWEYVLNAETPAEKNHQPSPKVLKLVAERQQAREQRDWAAADRLRERIAALGWIIQDTPEGPQLEPSE